MSADVSQSIEGFTHSIVFLDVFDTVSNLVLQEVIRPECIDVHVSTNGDQLRARQIIERKLIVKEFSNFDNIIC